MGKLGTASLACCALVLWSAWALLALPDVHLACGDAQLLEAGVQEARGVRALGQDSYGRGRREQGGPAQCEAEGQEGPAEDVELLDR
eukprot:15434233-Alexandrium_andersonii.AAC.1